MISSLIIIAWLVESLSESVSCIRILLKLVRHIALALWKGIHMYIRTYVI